MRRRYSVIHKQVDYQAVVRGLTEFIESSRSLIIVRGVNAPQRSAPGTIRANVHSPRRRRAA
jgi:hypothetical protein